MAHSRKRPAPVAPKDVPLRRDVRLLGQMLGELLREHGSQALYDRVESARKRAIARRAGDLAAEGELTRGLTGLQSPAALEVARAFSTWFGLVNLAERLQRLRRRASYRAKRAPQPGGLRAVVAELAKRGVLADELGSVLQSTLVEPVFTAHPTEALRRTLLVKELRMARALERRGAGPRERAVLQAVREELTIAWQTEEHRDVRPTVADELEQALVYVTESLWRAVPRVRRELAQALVGSYGKQAGKLARAVELRFGSWIGGDMDGNPSVGPDTIRASLARQSQLALERYVAELRALFRRLSQSRTRVEFSPEMQTRLAGYRERFPEVAARIPARYGGMLYRELLWLMTSRLEATRQQDAGAYGDAREFLDDLACIARCLAQRGGRSAGLRRVERTLRRVQCFGFHLATLDVRRDALDHRRAVAALLGSDDFATLAPEARARRLVEALETPPSGERAPAEGDALFALEVMHAIGDVRRRYGERAIGLYVISMAQTPDDALCVLYLARAAGLERDHQVPLDVAPLFETVEDLQRAPRTLDALLGTAPYRAHLAARGDRQWVMLGYSDSNKTSGMIASRVALERAQHELVAVAARHAIQLFFFHGRGGSIGRGGSKPRDAILSAPAGALAGHLRVTEQGEIVRAKYGLVGIAERTLEVLLAATIERTLSERRADSPAQQPDELEFALAREAGEAYRDLVEREPRFLAYFQAATPIDAIERLALGSRPARRREMQGVRDLRAIPWVFAWTQSRHLLPGWYGAGAALQASLRAHGVATLRERAARSNFLRVLLADLEMVLAKTDLGIARHYAALAGPLAETFLPRLRADYEAACDAVLEIGHSKRLLDRDPRLQRSIELRNPYVDPMSFLQVDLLARWRAAGRDDPELERALFATVRGIARGMQNTG